jgi:uncharacterized protein YycO
MSLKVVYSRSRSVGAVLIRAMPPWGPWSHCALVDGDAVIESVALKGGVVRTPLSDLLARSSAWMIVSVPCPDARSAIRWAEVTLGDRYDWGGVLSIPARTRSWDSQARWYCSEHCARALSVGGTSVLTPGMHGVTPSHLAQLTYAAGHKVLATGG